MTAPAFNLGFALEVIREESVGVRHFASPFLGKTAFFECPPVLSASIKIHQRLRPHNSGSRSCKKCILLRHALESLALPIAPSCDFLRCAYSFQLFNNQYSHLSLVALVNSFFVSCQLDKPVPLATHPSSFASFPQSK
jgi:hypothetical protein